MCLTYPASAGGFFTTSATKGAPSDFHTLPTLPCRIFQHFSSLEIDTPPGPPKMLENHKRPLSCVLPHEALCEGNSARPKPTSPLDSEAGRLLVVVSTQRLHVGPKLRQEVLLGVPDLRTHPAQLCNSHKLAQVTVKAQDLFFVVDLSGHKPHVLCPVGEVAHAFKLVHEILCGRAHGVRFSSALHPNQPLVLGKHGRQKENTKGLNKICSQPSESYPWEKFRWS